MGRNTVFHKENSYKEDLEDFILKALPPFTGTQSVSDILTSLKDQRNVVHVIHKTFLASVKLGHMFRLL